MQNGNHLVMSLEVKALIENIYATATSLPRFDVVISNKQIIHV
jgi:hypothetical protein